MFHLIKEVRDIHRFNQILVVLFEEGFDFLLYRMGLKKNVPLAKLLKKKLQKKEELRPEVRLRKTFEKLGPTFIKFGQILSVRPDLVPKEYAKELEKLQDSVPATPFSEIKPLIEKELGKSLEHMFLNFEKEPMASASISQVYRATLKTGEKVAVKVQRPDVKRVMETDIEIMEYIAKLLENNVEGIRRFKPQRIVREFKEWTEKELDFRLEARNAKRFHENFKNSKTVYIPKVYDELTSERIITLEFIDGIELHNIKEVKKRKINFEAVIKNGFEAIMTQVFVHGIFHADPHPGNIIILNGNRIAFIDFGIVGYFDDKLKNKCIDLFYGVIEQDSDMIVETLAGMGMEIDTDFEQLKSDIGLIIQPLQGASLKEIKLSKVIEEILDIGLKHRIRIPAQFVLFGKTIVTLEGVGLEYDPKFKLVETSRLFIERIIARRKNPIYMWKNMVHDLHKYRRFAEELPEKAEKVLDRLERGAVRIDIEDTDIKKLALELDRSSNRVAYGLLIAALLITSALLFQVEKGPEVLGVPLLSFISFFFASVFAFILFVSILREKFRHW